MARLVARAGMLFLMVALLAGCGQKSSTSTNDSVDSTAADVSADLSVQPTPDGDAETPDVDEADLEVSIDGDPSIVDVLDPCAANPCVAPHQSRCEPALDGFVCRCDLGFHLDPLTQECIEDDGPNPCDPNPCTEPQMSVCEPAGLGYTCKCDDGFEISQEFQSCVPIDRCSPNPCTAPNRSQCSVVGNSAVCDCDPGYKLENESCVAKNPCEPNPCTVGERTTCLAIDGENYECRCSVGYVEQGEGCTLVPTCDQRYASIVGKTGNALRQALFSYTGSKVSVMDYEAARAQIFWTLDYVSGQVQGVYSGKWVAVTKGVLPNYSKELNAEHTWPQSMGAEGDAKSDLHHLFPSIPNINSSRGNTPFGPVVIADKCYDPTGIVLCPFVTGDYYSIRGKDAVGVIVWEPADQHKGDVARAMFYFSVRYELPIDVRQEAAFRLWHVTDPVSPKELQRNDDIETLQHNRNPFIDCPHLVP
ncbi:MAG: endonuclease, partial [Myxococcales bacterium]|nr:endonuclease [Myxococcales bacterium]